MLTIHKFALVVTAEQNILLPDDAQPLTLQIQNGNPTVWILLNPDAPKRSRRVRMEGTGFDSTAVGNLCYLGTVQIEGFVWHYFLD